MNTSNSDSSNKPVPLPVGTSAGAAIESAAFVLCNACDYDLTGGLLDDGRLTCPECGYRQAPIPTAQWSSAASRLVYMLLPLVGSTFIAGIGLRIGATPVFIVGAGSMLITAWAGPVWVTWRTLRRGYASERRVATADRLMLVGIVINTLALGVLTFLFWSLLKELR